VSWSPNGVYKDVYRNALKNSQDVVDEIAQQAYDSVISYEQILVEVKKYVSLFGAGKVGLCCALPGSSGTGQAWSLPTCLDYLDRLHKDAGIRHTAFWEGAHRQVGQWAIGAKRVTR
jgi:hypothetical protein